MSKYEYEVIESDRVIEFVRLLNESGEEGFSLVGFSACAEDEIHYPHFHGIVQRKKESSIYDKGKDDIIKGKANLTAELNLRGVTITSFGDILECDHLGSEPLTLLDVHEIEALMGDIYHLHNKTARRVLENLRIALEKAKGKDA